MAKTYEHIDPTLVGNQRRILVSELSGKSNLVFKSPALSDALAKDPKATEKVLAGMHLLGAIAIGLAPMAAGVGPVMFITALLLHSLAYMPTINLTKFRSVPPPMCAVTRVAPSTSTA